MALSKQSKKWLLQNTDKYLPCYHCGGHGNTLLSAKCEGCNGEGLIENSPITFTNTSGTKTTTDNWTTYTTTGTAVDVALPTIVTSGYSQISQWGYTDLGATSANTSDICTTVTITDTDNTA